MERAQLETELEQELSLWKRYLRETSGLSVVQYEQVEPYAWTKLQIALTKLKERRRNAKSKAPKQKR